MKELAQKVINKVLHRPQICLAEKVNQVNHRPQIQILLLILMMVWIADVSAAIPPFTPVIDGSKDTGWGSTPTATSAGSNRPYNLCRDIYIVNDANYLYMGWQANGDPWDDTLSAHYMWALETGNDTAGSTNDPWVSTTRVVWANHPDFWVTGWIAWGNDNFGEVSDINQMEAEVGMVGHLWQEIILCLCPVDGVNGEYL